MEIGNVYSIGGVSALKMLMLGSVGLQIELAE
mgnify:CR=1 FL=1